jgi:YesN/AraC family two-component response regulator
MKKHGRYFVIPIVVFVLYSIGILYMTPEEHYIFSHSHDAKISNTNGIMLYQSIALLIFKIVFLVQSIIYVVLSTILANKHKAYVQNFYADNDHDFSKQYSYISLLLSLTIVIYIFLSIMDKDSFFVTGPFITYVSPILVSVLYFILGLFGSQQKSLLINEKHECVELYSDTCQTIEEDSHIHLDQIKTKILKLFEEDKIYLDCELNLWEVSRLVGTNRTYVSSVINNYFNQNFSSFVNKYRVKHTEELISENPKLTNEDLAALSGFGSVTSMHRAFLNIKGKSVKQIKKQV